MPEWIGVINTTAPKFLKGAADATIRERLLLAMMKKRGRFTMNASSQTLTWDVEFAQPPVEAFADAGTLNFSRHDLYRQATLDWRGYKATDMMTRKEYGMNDGDVAIVKRYDRIFPNLNKALTDTFGAELYIDGEAAANVNRLHGTASWRGGGGTTVVADIAGEPDQTSYAGRDTRVARQGTWSSDLGTSPNAQIATDWPDGNGDAEYDYFSPRLLNWSSTTWTGTNTFVSTAERCIRKAIQWMTIGGGKSSRPDLMMLAPNLYFDFQNLVSADRRILTPYKEGEELGFPTLQFEGVGLAQEFDIPADDFYGFNFDQMEMLSLFDTLFHHQGPDYDPRSDAWLFHVGFFGNMKWVSPKYFCYGTNYAAS